MTSDSNEYTRTMAQVYAAQGHWEKAVEIYRYLVLQEPDREDLRNALQDAEKRLVRDGVKRPDDLFPLLRTWLRLQTRVHQIEKLKKINK